ncbi:Omp28 family outer membrane lipoprotein [Xylanibacter rarus]|uniref:Omp28 family outer membrane lipoprotein n=1 Tax=Xylanibacter rarus TaxID=1676614 RepID=UPI003AB9B1DC
MKLKNNIYNKFAICAAALSLMACSNIDEDDRFIEVEPVEVAKRVLIEDFTGQRCVNCPNASEMIESLQEQYGAENIIAVGIHSGPFSKTASGRPLSLWTETGDYYFNSWNIDAQPTGVIDRKTVSSTYQSWGTIVRDALQASAPLTLGATTSYDEATRTVTINVNAKGVLDVTGKLQLWLIEDNITDMQAMPDGSINNNYVHNHVFRTAVNGQDGEDFSIAWDEEKTVTSTYVLNEDWNAENMSVVAFVYNNSGVQQVVKVPVISTEDDAQPNE